MPPFCVLISITALWLCRCAVSHSWQSHLPRLILTGYKGELAVWQLAQTLQQGSPESGCSWQKAPLCGCRAVLVPVSAVHVVTAVALGICASRECTLSAPSWASCYKRAPLEEMVKEATLASPCPLRILSLQQRPLTNIQQTSGCFGHPREQID